MTDCKFALVAFRQTTSAKLQNLDQDIHVEFKATQGFVTLEEQALEKKLKH